MSKTKEFSDEIKKLIPGGAHTYSKGYDQFPSNAPGIIKKGKGVYIWDMDDNKYLSFCMGLTSVGLGHAYQPVIEAVKALRLPRTVRILMENGEDIVTKREESLRERQSLQLRIRSAIRNEARTQKDALSQCSIRDQKGVHTDESPPGPSNPEIPVGLQKFEDRSRTRGTQTRGFSTRGTQTRGTQTRGSRTRGTTREPRGRWTEIKSLF